MTPLERVAAKLAALHPAWRETPWASIGAETRELFLEDARDVLREIREPSAAMIEAGNDVQHDDDCTDLRSVWQAMIDAALSE